MKHVLAKQKVPAMHAQICGKHTVALKTREIAQNGSQSKRCCVTDRHLPSSANRWWAWQPFRWSIWQRQSSATTQGSVQCVGTWRIRFKGMKLTDGFQLNLVRTTWGVDLCLRVKRSLALLYCLWFISKPGNDATWWSLLFLQQTCHHLQLVQWFGLVSVNTEIFRHVRDNTVQRENVEAFCGKVPDVRQIWSFVFQDILYECATIMNPNMNTRYTHRHCFVVGNFFSLLPTSGRLSLFNMVCDGDWFD